MSAQLNTLRHYPKHRALHVNTLLAPRIDPLCKYQLILFLVQPLHDQFKEEMVPKVTQNVFELNLIVNVFELNLRVPKDQTRAWTRWRSETKRPTSRTSTWASSVPWGRPGAISSRSC